MSRRDKNPLGQYFTPRNIAEMMVALINHQNTVEVLEPCCGEGIFLEVLQEHKFKKYTALEIDSKLSCFDYYSVINTSYLSWRSQKQFDVIIGNPPYIRWKDLHEAAKEEMQQLPSWKSLFNSLSDYLAPFIVESIKRLKPGGELIFITPAFWMHTLHTKNLRDWMIAQGRITDIIDFGEARVFKGVATSIVIFKYVLGSNDEQIKYRRYIGENKVPQSKLSLDDLGLFQETNIPRFQQGRHWTLASSVTQERVSKLEFPSRPTVSNVLFSDDFYISLGEYINIANGMVSGLDKAFQIPEEEVSALNSNELKATLRVVKAKNLNRFFSDKTNLYIDVPKGLSEDLFLESFPNFSRLLSSYKAKLAQRYSYGRELPYWEWAFKRSESFLTNKTKKGFVPCKERLTSKVNVRFSLVPDFATATQDVTAFAPKDGVQESIEYIVGYLTLPEVTEWIRSKGLMKGGVAEFSEKPISMIPFRPIDFKDTGEKIIHNQTTEIMRQYFSNNQGVSKADLESMHDGIRQLLV